MKTTKHTHKLAFLVTLLLVGLALGSPAWALDYTITDLGTLGGTHSAAYSINGNSQVVGEAYTGDNSGRSVASMVSILRPLLVPIRSA